MKRSGDILATAGFVVLLVGLIAWIAVQDWWEDRRGRRRAA